MAVNLKGRDFLKLLDFSAEEIGYFLDLAADLKDKKKKGVPHKMFEGKNIALIFEKTSTRTRCSFEVAGHDLGMGTTTGKHVRRYRVPRLRPGDRRGIGKIQQGSRLERPYQ